MRKMDVMADVKLYYRLFTDAWLLFRNYADIGMDETERWKALTEEINSLCRMFGNPTVARKLLVGVVLDEIETISRVKAFGKEEEKKAV